MSDYTTINAEQRLYVFDHGSHFTTLGFAKAKGLTASYAAFAQRPDLAPPDEEGTQAAVDAYWAALRAAIDHHATTRERDYSDTNAKLRPYNGQRVRVERPYVTLSGREVRTFIVGQTTGWRPATLYIDRRSQRGSSDLIPPTYDPGHVTPLSR